jgi:hypothetical protein
MPEAPKRSEDVARRRSEDVARRGVKTLREEE